MAAPLQRMGKRRRMVDKHQRMARLAVSMVVLEGLHHMAADPGTERRPVTCMIFYQHL
jgi:hypothetical protein